MADLGIHLVTDDAEHSGPLRDALVADGLPLVDAAVEIHKVAVAVVATDAWDHGRDLLAEGFTAAIILCTGSVPQPPADATDSVVVRHWSDAETAVAQVQLFLNRTAKARGMSLADAQPPAVELQPPLSAPAADEPALVEDFDVLDAAEPELIDEAELLHEAQPGTAPPQRPTRAAMPQLEQITPEDREFINRVFNQVRDVDFRSPPPPPPRKSLAGLDKKMHFLREKVRELERDLARTGHVWRVKQVEVERVEQIIDAKEAERSAAVQRYQQIKDQATRAAQQSRAEIDQLKAHVADLDATRNGLEGSLARLKSEHDRHVAESTARIEKEEREKQALVADFRAKIEEAQNAFAQLREQSARAIADLEKRLEETRADLEGRLQATQQELETSQGALREARETIEARDNTIAELEQTLAQTRADLEGRIGSLETDLGSARDAQAATAAQLAERDQTVATLTAELASTRQSYEERVAELKAEKSAREEKNATLDAEVKSARQEFEQLAREYASHRDEAGRVSEELGQSLADARAEARVANDRIVDLERGIANLQSATASSQSQLSAAQEQARLATIDKETLGSELGELQRRVGQLEQELVAREERLAEANTALETAGNDARIATTDKDAISAELDSARKRIYDLEQQMQARDAQLTDARARLTSAQEEARLAKQDAETIGARLAELQSS